ncbi:MAG: Fe-S-containing protein [Deltaproteobacteria bacterium]|nr:Fe-S-containing protein [Deltaproteobacteria bacterium]
MYLINVVENSWLLALGAPLIMVGLSDPSSGRIDRPIRRLTALAFGLGLLSAMVLAFLRLNTGWVIREFYDLGVLLPAVAMMILFLVFSNLGSLSNRKMIIGRIVAATVAAAVVWGIFFKLTRRRSMVVYLVAFHAFLFLFSFGPLKIRAPYRLIVFSGTALLAFLTARVTPNLMLYPFEFGVGLDSVFNAEYLSKVAGYLLGFGVCAFLWFSVAFLARQAPPGLWHWFVGAGLLVLLAQLALEASQILAARRLVPSWVFRVVLFTLERKNIFFMAQAAVWGLLALWLMVRARVTVPVGSNPALRRKMRAQLRSDFRSGVSFILAMTLVIFTATTLRAVNQRGPVIAEPDPVTASGGQIVLELDSISDGNLHRRVYQTESGTPVRFIVIKKSQSAFGVGLDACDICGQSGYYQRGDQVICKLCDVVMNKSTIGFPGGCNPVPLDFKLTEGKMLIMTDDLEDEAHRFK